jgi:hypothetical protein
VADKAFLWDACVLYRWLNEKPAEYIDHIGKYLEEAPGTVGLYVSTITLAEIRPSAVNREGLTPSQVLAGISGSFVLIDTSPDIMSLAGYLRDRTYRHIDGPADRAPGRPLGTGDAIQLATAVALREEYGVQNLTLHTFDEGKKKDGIEGKRGVPIIGFENWCRDCVDDEEVQKVISVPRKKPVHPSCPLPQKDK